MEEINALRQQLAAAHFLANSLTAQLQRAEEQYAAAQQFHHRHLLGNGASVLERGENLDGGREGANLGAAQGEDHGYLPDYEQSSTERPNQSLAEVLRGDDTPDRDQNEDDATAEEHDTLEYPDPEGTTLPTLEVKQTYPTLGDVKATVESYALAQGWTARTKKRDRLRVFMGCRSTKTCPYDVRAEMRAEGARITRVRLGHTCCTAIGSPGDPSMQPPPPKRHHASRMRFLREEVPKLMELTSETPSKDIQEAVFQRFGTLIPIAQCTKLRGPSRRKKPALQGCKKCGITGHNRLTCKAQSG
ncbi:hypothetical protein LTR08_005262 [Meristemomyces frigidus]|nr:hypothetical protein LTR08_005262 [Meristemomyces frigidus]